MRCLHPLVTRKGKESCEHLALCLANGSQEVGKKAGTYLADIQEAQQTKLLLQLRLYVSNF